MAKLYFRYGTMGSAKTMNLLAVAHTYQLQKKRVLILKPAVDTRFGEADVRSRSGMTKSADRLMAAGDRLTADELSGLSCILVDEAQFLSSDVIDHLRDLSVQRDIPVICYGLRTDFRREVFPGSRRLLELADAIEEVKSTCHYCNKKAVFNMRLFNDAPVFHGPQLQLGADETYQAVCSRCYHEFSTDSASYMKKKRMHLRPVESEV